jgi:hypothetical protein|tara:strand:- start:385 stop:1419 length:1035 start_codon:yes stop_codon:yes gene_type:complete
MAVPSKYQAKEVLNKVLNSGEDALNVDIDNVTLTTEGGDVAIDVALDKANDSVTIYANTAADGSGDSTVPLVDAAGNLQIDIVSSALPSGGATAANQSTIIGHVDGIETLITSTNSKIDTFDAVLDNILTKNTEIDAVLDTIKTDTQEIEEAVETIEGAVSGSEMQVDVVASLPAGSAAIGKLAANSGVDIGDVDVTSVVPGTGATNLGKAIQSAQGSTDTGVAALAVRNDALADLSGADGDYTPLQVNKTGALNVTENTGYLGAIFEDGTDNITSKKVVAIQFLEDTTFTTLTPEDSSYIGTASGNGDAIDTSNTFPQGMTIFGRWTGFRLASGTIVAYQGDW